MASGIYTPEQLGIRPPKGGFQTGGWYEGRQYWNGTFSDPGVIHPWSNQQGAGQAVSQEVRAQSAAAQGVSLQDFNAYLERASVTNIQTPVTPSYTTGANQNYITGLNAEVEAARKALEEQLKQNQARVQAELEAARKREQEALQGVKELTTPFREELEKTERQRYGTEEVLAKQRSLLDELDQLLTEGNNLIKQQMQVTGLAAIRNPRIQKTMDDVAARAGVINAVVNMQNTYLANAYQAIDRTMSAITQDRQDRLTYYETVLNLANRDIIQLDNKSQEFAKEQINLLKFDLERATKTVDYIKELMVNPDTALALAQSGVSLNDSIETINKKLADYQYVREVREQANKITMEGGVLVTDPKSVPADQLKSFTDSRGRTHYYKMPKTATTTSSSISFPTLSSKVGISATGDRWRILDPLQPIKGTKTLAPNFVPESGYGTVVYQNGFFWVYTPSGWVSY